MSNAPEQLRRQIRHGARGLVPERHIDEVVDLAMHAVENAFKVVGDVTTRASIAPVAICATGIALSVIAGEARAKLDSLAEAAPNFGMAVHVVRAQVGGDANG